MSLLQLITGSNTVDFSTTANLVYSTIRIVNHDSTKILALSTHNQNFPYYISPPLISPLPPKATPLISPDLRCTEVIKYYLIVPLKKDHPSCKATFSLQKVWP